MAMRSRVTLAIFGMLLMGVIGAIGAVVTTPGPHTTLQSQQANNPTSGASTSTLPTATATSSEIDQSPTQSANPTATTPPAPTRTPSGQVTRSGPIVSGTIDKTTQTFQISANGIILTVAVDGSTQYSGVAQSFSTLQDGQFASVTGTFQPNGYLLATSISTSTNNDN